MYHPTEKELIQDALNTQVALLCGIPRLSEVATYNASRWEELNRWYSDLVYERIADGTGFRYAHCMFSEKYTKQTLEHWLKTGVYLPNVKIHGETVLRFLKTRNSSPDFMRDVLDITLVEGNVVVRIVDKVSGGSSAHVTDLDPQTFETQYGK